VSSLTLIDKIILVMPRIDSETEFRNYLNFIQSIGKSVTCLRLTMTFQLQVTKKLIEAFPCIKELTIHRPRVYGTVEECCKINCETLETVFIEFYLGCGCFDPEFEPIQQTIANARKLLKTLRFNLIPLKHFRLVFHKKSCCDCSEFKIDEKMFEEFFNHLSRKLVKKNVRSEINEEIYKFSVDQFDFFDPFF
jgi:hypothetical protein